jgi:hypothetical protein
MLTFFRTVLGFVPRSDELTGKNTYVTGLQEDAMDQQRSSNHEISFLEP